MPLTSKVEVIMQKNDIGHLQFFKNKQKESVASNSAKNIKITKNKPHVSSLYNTLMLLTQKKDAAIENFTITHNNTQEVFYIHLDKPANELLFKNYNFKDNHLTVHKYYQNKDSLYQHGLSMAHYTETYINSNNSMIVVRIYFNNVGSYQYARIKHYADLNNRARFEVIKIDSFIEENLRVNAAEAKKVLQILLHRNQELHHQFSSRAEELLAQLEEISKSLHADAVCSYVKTAKIFIEAIDSLNKYIDVLQQLNTYIDLVPEEKKLKVKELTEELAQKEQLRKMAP